MRSTNIKKIDDYFKKLTTKATQPPHRKMSHDQINPDHVTKSARTPD